MKTKFSAALAAMGAASALICSHCALAGTLPGKTGAAATVLAQARTGNAAARASILTQGDNRHGTPADGMPYDREIRIAANTGGLNIARLETIRFVSADGREFRWTFDVFRRFEVFPLADIAPENFPVPATARVYVNGDIPVAP